MSTSIYIEIVKKKRISNDRQVEMIVKFFTLIKTDGSSLVERETDAQNILCLREEEKKNNRSIYIDQTNKDIWEILARWLGWYPLRCIWLNNDFFFFSLERVGRSIDARFHLLDFRPFISCSMSFTCERYQRRTLRGCLTSNQYDLN